jgi:hypothetical protein
MLDKTLIGRESEPTVVEVEKGAIRRFAEALGDANPLALDEAAAQAAGYPSLVAPPTFAVTLGWTERFRHSLDLGTRAVLHGDQSFEYARPLVSGSIATTTDTDYYKVTVAAGKKIVATLTPPATAALGMVVYTASGQQLLAINGATGQKVQVTVTNGGSAAAPLVLRVVRASGATGAYTLGLAN